MGLDFLRQAAWLDAARVRGYLLLLAVLNVAVLLFLVASSRGGVDRNGFLLGTDFLSFWTSGRMLQAGGDVYDAAQHVAVQRRHFAQEGAYTAFFYPPPFLLFCAPLGWLGYMPGLALWLGTTGAAYLLAARAWLARAAIARPLLVLFAAFPPVLVAITHGQSAFLVAALLGGGTLLVPSRPWLAGVLLGLAVIKPQFGLLLPIVLLVTGQWRVICAALGAAAVLALAATSLFGAEIWSGWLGVTGAAQAAMAEGAVPFAKLQSPFAAARLLAAPIPVAYAVQGLVTLTVAGAVAWAGWRRSFGPALAALTLAGAPLVTPFVLDYDLVLVAFPLIWLAGQRPRAWDRLILAGAFVIAAFARPLALEVGVPITPFVLAALFLAVLRRAVEQPRTAR